MTLTAPLLNVVAVPRFAKKLAVVVGVIVLLLLISFALFTTDSSAPLPSPNGYDEFVRAGLLVTGSLEGGRDLGDDREMSLAELRSLALSNAEPRRIVVAALDRQCQVPVQNNDEWFRAHLSETSSFIQITRVFDLTGRLAQMEGRTNDAVGLYLDLVRFAHECARGGVVTDASVSRTVEDLGMSRLKIIRESLDSAQNLQIARTLEELDARRETWSDFSKRDFRYQLSAEFTTIFSWDTWQVRRRTKARFYQHEVQRRQATLDYAVRAYERQEGKRPGNLTNLVPNFLKAIPKDPRTHKNLVPSL